MHVVIVGAGIIGAACADALSSAGCQVTLLESHSPGSGTTAAGMGHVVVMDDSPAQFALTHYSSQLWQKLAPKLPPSCEYQACGTLWVAADDEEMQAVRTKHEYLCARGIPSQILDGRDLYQAEPHLRPGLAGGLLVPEDSVVYPPSAAGFLTAKAVRQGARLLQPAPVENIEWRGARLRSGELISGDIIVNAAGAAAPSLTPGLEIRPRKGHLVITERYPGLLRHQLVELGYLKSAHSISSDSVAFNLQPRATGQILIGSSRQYGDATADVHPAILQRMLARAREYMPILGRLTATRIWTGFRPATPDKLPFIGPWLGRDDLWIAAGHEGLGITTALGTAQLLADQILGRTPAIAPEPYRPSRPQPRDNHV